MIFSLFYFYFLLNIEFNNYGSYNRHLLRLSLYIELFILLFKLKKIWCGKILMKCVNIRELIRNHYRILIQLKKFILE